MKKQIKKISLALTLIFISQNVTAVPRETLGRTFSTGLIIVGISTIASGVAMFVFGAVWMATPNPAYEMECASGKVMACCTEYCEHYTSTSTGRNERLATCRDVKTLDENKRCSMSWYEQSCCFSDDNVEYAEPRY